MLFRPKPGRRVIHRSLEKDEIYSQDGVVEEVIGDDKPRLVILEQDGKRVAYDERELITLLPNSGNQPVLSLHPHALAALVKRPWFWIICSMLIIFVSAMIVLMSSIGISFAVLIGLGFILLALGIYSAVVEIKQRQN
jgi:hypothetical protein